MNLTTPSRVTGKLRAFMKQLSPKRPVLLPYTDLNMNMRVGNCHGNVDRIVTQRGGKAVFGWMIWSDPYTFDAEFHCVWQDEAGTLHDVTPRGDGEKEILFLPDPSRKFDWKTSLTYLNVCRPKHGPFNVGVNGDGFRKMEGVDKK